jgi:hypothetical protein
MLPEGKRETPDHRWSTFWSAAIIGLRCLIPASLQEAAKNSNVIPGLKSGAVILDAFSIAFSKHAGEKWVKLKASLSGCRHRFRVHRQIRPAGKTSFVRCRWTLPICVIEASGRLESGVGTRKAGLPPQSKWPKDRLKINPRQSQGNDSAKARSFFDRIQPSQRNQESVEFLHRVFKNDVLATSIVEKSVTLAFVTHKLATRAGLFHRLRVSSC